MQRAANVNQMSDSIRRVNKQRAAKKIALHSLFAFKRALRKSEVCWGVEGTLDCRLFPTISLRATVNLLLRGNLESVAGSFHLQISPAVCAAKQQIPATGEAPHAHRSPGRKTSSICNVRSCYISQTRESSQRWIASSATEADSSPGGVKGLLRQALFILAFVFPTNSFVVAENAGTLAKFSSNDSPEVGCFGF